MSLPQQFYFSLRNLLKIIAISIVLSGLLSSCLSQDESDNTGEIVGPKNIENKKQECTLEPMKILGTTVKKLKNKDDVFVGECIEEIEVDMDLDKISEIVCPRRIITKEDTIYSYSFLIDLFTKGHKWILRQKFDRGNRFYGMEKFFDIVDITGDNIPELITKLQISSDCVRCESHRIYSFKNGQFENALSLFNTNPYDVGCVLKKLSEIQEAVITYCKKATGKKVIYWNELVGDYRFDLWLLDSNHDGKMEIVQLLEPLKDDILDGPYTESEYIILIMELSSEGSIEKSASFSVEMKDRIGSASIIGLLKQNNESHLFIIENYTGNSGNYPALQIFRIEGLSVTKINDFYGFYYHELPQRFKDLNQDGDIEIIYVGGIIWPSGSPHCDAMPEYYIAEFSEKDGKYLEANEKFKDTQRRLNRHIQ